MSNKTHLFEPLNEAEQSRIRGMAIKDIEKEAESAKATIREISQACDEVDGIYNFDAASKKLGKPAAELKEQISRANAHFHYCNSTNIEKTKSQNYRTTLTTPIVGEEEQYASWYQGAPGEPLIQMLENKFGMDKLLDFKNPKSIQIEGASFGDIRNATMTKGVGGSANPPTGITPNRPVNVELPYEAVDRRRNLQDMLPVIAVSNDQFKYRKEIDAGVANPANATGMPNYMTAENAASPVQDVGAKEATANIETVRAIVSMTKEQVADVSATRQFASMILGRQMADTTENQIFNGNGTSPQLDGIFSVSGTKAIARTNAETRKLFDFWVDAHSQYAKPRGGAATDGSGTYPTHIFLNDAAVRLMQKEKTTDGEYLWGDPGSPALSNVWGTPIVINDFVPADSAVMMNIDPRYILLVTRSGVELETGLDGNDFSHYRVSMRISQRLSLAVIRPSTILKVTNLDGVA